MKTRKKLSIPEKHQLKIAYDTLRMPDAMAAVMGGPTKVEARVIIRTLTGKTRYEILRDEQMDELQRIKGKGWMPGGSQTTRITPKTPRLRR